MCPWVLPRLRSVLSTSPSSKITVSNRRSQGVTFMNGSLHLLDSGSFHSLFPASSIFSFLQPAYTYSRQDGVVNIPVSREIIEDGRTQVTYRTRDLTAKDKLVSLKTFTFSYATETFLVCLECCKFVTLNLSIFTLNPLMRYFLQILSKFWTK